MSISHPLAFVIALTGLGSLAFASVASAKLPVAAPTPESIAKADEAKAKAADAAKKESELLAKYQDDVAGKYAAKLRSEGKEFKPTPIALPAAPTATAAPIAGTTPATSASAATATPLPKK
jgi:hypothetical protein